MGLCGQHPLQELDARELLKPAVSQAILVKLLLHVSVADGHTTRDDDLARSVRDAGGQASNGYDSELAGPTLPQSVTHVSSTSVTHVSSSNTERSPGLLGKVAPSLSYLLSQVPGAETAFAQTILHPTEERPGEHLGRLVGHVERDSRIREESKVALTGWVKPVALADCWQPLLADAHSSEKTPKPCRSRPLGDLVKPKDNQTIGAAQLKPIGIDCCLDHVRHTVYVTRRKSQTILCQHDAF